MKLGKKTIRKAVTALVALQLFAVTAVPVFAAETTGNAVVKIRLMETTDIHTNVVNYDYYSDKPTDEYGYAKTATLIKQARAEAKNSVLIDNGDLLQGTPLGDYMAKVNPLKPGEVHPVYKAMNQFGYDAGNYGNHEFNYGLDFLANAVKGANFPYVNANIYTDDGTGKGEKNYFTPYLILDKKVTDETGKTHNLKVGVIGFVPPQIMQWDSANLNGKVVVKDIVETAQKFIPQMKAEGADIIIAVPHSGFEDIPQTELMENSVLYLSKVPGIDAIMFGHAHKVFPSSDFAGKTGVDLAKGTINGVPSVEPGFWGDHLGIIDMELIQDGNKWKVTHSTVEARPIYDKATKSALVGADQSVVDSVYKEHEQTLDYIRGPVGTTTARITSYFALVKDDPSIQIVTNAQKWYLQQKLQGTDYESLPILSAGAPFKAGGRSGANYYTDIPAGTIAIKNVSDLYVYPNTVYAVKVNGAEVKNWLEWSAGQFNQIDPSKTAEQPLINMDFPTYNFDVIDGVTYQIDVTQPAKYDGKGNIINEAANRIVNLEYNGKPIDPKQEFIVATNNYRASSSKLANPDGKRIVLAAPDENRQVIIDYIRENKTINPTADGNWSFAPIKGKANVTFNTSPNAQSALSTKAAVAGAGEAIAYAGSAADGFAKYTIDLSQAAAPATGSEPTKPVTPAKPVTPSKPATPATTPATPAKPVTPVKTPAKDTAEQTYTVKRGDNLYRIGLKYGVSWEELAKFNKITDPKRLQVGDVLEIPVS
ncbi:bifunctional 2',3'-cyclic-nucleotide 2'-phosphodiesterase/3'-nucleotidase [Paenibacillus campi]|uniref:bifunctional 2',3'-cyclic-nucleotide 2'-phosphodiesterase/3'-nucleotidase n=1 Tax=Paenibacillus campi TaxID=3106031 RepID=UPI002B00055B|nr:bifunctional 2',3'-cyclic-nucleotide 2'-phosphodiesterase/3'-nucleotidase [Paenibacillus sp. SGZ-1009]